MARMTRNEIIEKLERRMMDAVEHMIEYTEGPYKFENMAKYHEGLAQGYIDSLELLGVVKESPSYIWALHSEMNHNQTWWATKA